LTNNNQIKQLEHELPDEENVFKFYNFLFASIEKPVMIGARNRTIARELLKDALKLMGPEYGFSKVISETVTNPVEGVSKLTIDGVENVWCGLKKSGTGWMPEKEYEESIKK
jgi:hypothetical protein